MLLYFVEKEKGDLTPENLKELGLGHIKPLNVRSATNGPGGKPGSTFISADHKGIQPNLIGFFEKKQTWGKCEDGNFYICEASKTDPKDLEKENKVPGFPVELLDGNKWSAPVVSRMLGGTQLPQAISLDSSGTLEFETTEEFKALEKVCEKHFEDFLLSMDEESKPEDVLTMTNQDFFDLGCLAIGSNYHVSKWELSFLKVFDTTSLIEVANIAIDINSLEEIAEGLKKKE